MDEYLAAKCCPLWEQDEDGTWITISVGAEVKENLAGGRTRKGVVTRIVPVEGYADRLDDTPEEYRLWGDVYVRWTPEN